jgi:hypothetical protein
VPYTASDGAFAVSVPEGWARSSDGSGVRFGDKLNAIRIDAAPAAQAPTVDAVRVQDLPTLPLMAGSVRTPERVAAEARLSDSLAA